MPALARRRNDTTPASASPRATLANTCRTFQLAPVTLAWTRGPKSSRCPGAAQLQDLQRVGHDRDLERADVHDPLGARQVGVCLDGGGQRRAHHHHRPFPGEDLGRRHRRCAARACICWPDAPRANRSARRRARSGSPGSWLPAALVTTWLPGYPFRNATPVAHEDVLERRRLEEHQLVPRLGGASIGHPTPPRSKAERDRQPDRANLDFVSVERRVVGHGFSGRQYTRRAWPIRPPTFTPLLRILTTPKRAVGDAVRTAA